MIVGQDTIGMRRRARTACPPRANRIGRIEILIFAAGLALGSLGAGAIVAASVLV